MARSADAAPAAAEPATATPSRRAVDEDATEDQATHARPAPATVWAVRPRTLDILDIALGQCLHFLDQPLRSTHLAKPKCRADADQGFGLLGQPLRLGDSRARVRPCRTPPGLGEFRHRTSAGLTGSDRVGQLGAGTLYRSD